MSGRNGSAAPPPISLEARFWFNSEINSRHYLIPGAIAIIMTLIGTLLTALVVAREWEHGTMEAVMSTPASVLEILLGKLIPYFGLGLLATFGCTLLATHAFGVPLRGSVFRPVFAYVGVSGTGARSGSVDLDRDAQSIHRVATCGICRLSAGIHAFGLSYSRSAACQRWLQVLTYVVPARYFVASLQTVFLAGDVWGQFIPNILAMLAIGVVLVCDRRAKHAQDGGRLAMRLGAQMVKELLSYFRDPAQRLSLFGPPLIQLFILSSAATLEVSNVDIAVFNEDSGSAAHEMIERIKAAHFVDEIIMVDRQATITQMIDQRKVLAGIHFSPDFSRDVAAGRPATVQVLIDGRRANAGQIAFSYLQTIVGEYGTALGGTQFVGVPQPEVRQLVQREPAVFLVFRPRHDGRAGDVAERSFVTAFRSPRSASWARSISCWCRRRRRSKS